MKNKLCLLLVSAGLALGIAAPAQAASTASPSSLDFGTFAANAVPTDTLTSTITGGTDLFFAGVEMLAGKSYFYPSSYCQEAEKNFPPCPVNVRVAYPLTATGPLTGTIGVNFTKEGFSEHPKIDETIEIQVKANVTAAAITPPVIPPSVVPPTTAPTPAPVKQQPKKPCKKGQRSTKSKPCTKAKAKGKGKGNGHKGGGKSKGR